MKHTKILLVFAAVLMFAASVSAQSYNATDAREAIEQARQEVNEMENQGVPTSRVESLLTEANQSYRAQKTLAANGGNPDYSRVIDLAQQIQDLKNQALEVNDQLEALEMRLNELNDTGLNLSEARSTYRAANESFHDQRFEEAASRIETAYSQISEAQSVRTQFEAFASAQQKNIIGTIRATTTYIAANWKKISAGSAVALFFGMILFQRSKVWLLNNRVERLEAKKKVLDSLVKQAQEEYFVKGQGSSISFETRMDRFEQMKRAAEEEINTLESRIEDEQDSLFYIGPDHLAEPEEEEEEKAEETEAPPVTAREFSDYGEMVEELTVKEVEERLRNVEEPEYDAVLEAEKEHKDRVTLERYLQQRLESQRDIDYEEVVSAPVKEVKQRIEEIKFPDYSALLVAERENRNRKTLKRYLRRQLPDYYRPDYEEIVNEHTVDEVKEEVDEMEEPDYGKMLEIEKENKGRKTLVDYLEEKSG